MKRKLCIFLIVLGGIFTYLGVSFLSTGLSLMKIYGDADTTVPLMIIGIVGLALGLPGIFGGIAAKRRVNRNARFSKEDLAFNEALENIDPDVLAKLKRERAQDMLTEEEFRQQVILKAQKHY